MSELCWCPDNCTAVTSSSSHSKDEDFDREPDENPLLFQTRRQSIPWRSKHWYEISTMERAVYDSVVKFQLFIEPDFVDLYPFFQFYLCPFRPICLPLLPKSDAHFLDFLCDLIMFIYPDIWSWLKLQRRGSA